LFFGNRWLSDSLRTSSCGHAFSLSSLRDWRLFPTRDRGTGFFRHIRSNLAFPLLKFDCKRLWFLLLSRLRLLFLIAHEEFHHFWWGGLVSRHFYGWLSVAIRTIEVSSR
jgi:hypothetical protein